MTAVHDSFSGIFRSPFGAAKTGSDVSLSLFTDIPCRVTALTWYGDTEQSYEMSVSLFELDGKSGYMHRVLLHMPASPGLLWYMFRIDRNGCIKYYCGTHGEGYLADAPESSYKITIYIPFTLPLWYKNAIVYQIFPDRFARGGGTGGLLRISTHTNIGQSIYIHDSWDDDVISQAQRYAEHYDPCDFFCGDLRGIEENLPYLLEMGVNCIYLNPIFSSPSNHRYDTSDYMHVDGLLGGDEAFFSLKRACEECGIHIMLDGVFSHTGADSIYFNRYDHFDSCGAYQSRESPYFSWYDFRNYPDEYRSWWGFPTLPETNEDDPSFREHIAQVISKWKTSWRLDVADELTDGFMYFLRDRIKQEDTDCVMIGEVWEDASDKHSKGHRRPYTDGNCLDGVMNYPLRSWIIDFLNGDITAERFVYCAMSMKESYPQEFLSGCLNILGSHDTERIRTVMKRNNFDKNSQQVNVFYNKVLTNDEKKVILAMCILYLMDGVPCIWYGDEQGMEGERDPFCRRPFHKTGSAIHSVCISLGDLKRNSRAFMGDAKLYAYGEDVLVISRASEGEQVICCVNRSDTKQHIRHRAEGGIYTDVFTQAGVCTVNGFVETETEPYSVSLLCLQTCGGF